MTDFSANKANEIAVKAAIDNAAAMARMGEQVAYVVKGIDSLNVKMDAVPSSYHSTKDFIEFRSMYEAEYLRLQNQVASIQKVAYIGIGIMMAVNLFILVSGNFIHLK